MSDIAQDMPWLTKAWHAVQHRLAEDRLPHALLVAGERGVGGLLGIDMDELVVTGAVGKRIDTLLVDGQPVGVTEFLADEVLQLCDGYLWHESSGLFL